MSRLSKRSISAALTIGLIGLFAVPGEVRAAEQTFTVVDGAGVPIPNAFIAIVKADGDAVDGSITGADGTAKFDDANASGYIVTAPGYKPKTGSSVATATVTLEASTNSRLATANAYGGQVTSLAADGGSGISYVTTPEAKPSLWRSTDYGGSWSAVPTTADSANGIPQEQVSEVFTSGVEGEVAAVLNSGLYYSRDYGTTWKKVSGYETVGGAPQERDFHWVHAGTSSYLFVNNNTAIWAAVMPKANTDSEPTLASFSAVTKSAGSKIAFVGAKTSDDVFAVVTNATDTTITSLQSGATTVGGITAGASSTVSVSLNATSSSGDLLFASTLGSNSVKAIVAYDIESSAGVIKVAFNNGTSWVERNDNAMVSPGNNPLTGSSLQALSGVGQSCGENGTNPVGSIAPAAPAGALADFEVVGTIRQCFFLFNDTGTAAFGSTGATLGARSIAVLPMQGANNNTGFVWDSATNFTNNMVTLTGDGQFGVRKSANISAATDFRPQFGGGGDTSAANYLNFQAKAGTGLDSGGIAMTGITAPSITDVAYSPNSTDGSSYVVSMTATGGSRTLLTTDGGTSFSTIGAGGSKAVEWWNGAGGLQHIAAGFAFNESNFLHVKSFNTTSGAAALEMGDELAATAAARDAADPAARKAFTFSGAANPSGSPLRPRDFVVGASSGAPANAPDLIAIEGVPGSNQMYVAVNRCTGNTGPSGCTTDGGTVAVMDLSASTSTGAVTLSNVKFYGSELAASGVSAVTAPGYTAGINAIQYCPAGSNSRVAGTLFVAVAGKGIYKIANGTHSATGTTTGTFKDLKIDCDTGLMMGVQSDGLYFSFNGDTFVKANLPQAANVQNATSLALQAEGSTGGVTAVIGNEQGDIAALETDVAVLGSTNAAVQAGNASNPAAPPSIPADDAVVVNSAQTGKATGRVADIELPNNATDKVTASSVRKMSASSKMAVGTGSGAFKATLTGSAPGTQAPGTNAPGTVTPISGPVATFPKLAKGRSSTVAAIAKRAGLEVPVGAAVKAAVGGASKKICRVTKTKIQGLAPGRCSLTITVTPKGGTATKRSVTLNITGVPTIKRGKAITTVNAAAAAGLPTGKGYKVRGVVASTSKAQCKVIGGRLIGVVAGACSVTLTVTSPTGVVTSKKLKSVVY